MDIRNIVIIGSGLIGKGLALVYSACKDVSITLYDIKDEGVIDAVLKNMRQLEAHGILSAAEIEDRMSRISFTTDFDAPCFAKADFVAEAVFEEMKLKQDLFVQLEAKCRKDAIFATNTSVMSITEISSKIEHRERLVGTHFWNPAHLIPLVEVVKSDYTSDEVAQFALNLLNRCGKVAVICKKDVPGFIGNRMQHALWREAIWLLENDVADIETIDKTVKYSFGLRLPQLGPMENIDMVGADLVCNIHEYLFPHISDTHKASPILQELRAKGKLGFKAGGDGLQQWTPEQIEKSRKDLNEYLIKMIYNK